VTDNYFELLLRAKVSRLTDEELESVVHDLTQLPLTESQQRQSLHILGLHDSASYRTIVEPFLHKKVVSLAKLALWILCTYWDLAEDYADDVLNFLKGVEWDQIDEIRITAATIAGKYLSRLPNKALLEALFTILENEQEDSILRQVAYISLLQAMGVPSLQLPQPSLETDIIDENHPLIHKARERVKNEI